MFQLFKVDVHHIDSAFPGAATSFLFRKTETSIGPCRCLDLTLTSMSIGSYGPVQFRAGYDSSIKRLSVSSFHPREGGGSLRIEPARLRGHHIGTFLMNEIVTWARQWPDAIVNPIRLFDADADDDNRNRRNRFYERFGFTFEYDDKDRTTGRSRDMVVSDLVPALSWTKNITLSSFDATRTGRLPSEQRLFIV